jgi:hypothetical protein
MKLRHDFKFPTSGVADRGKFPQQLVRKAIEIAKKHQDQMTVATKKIEKLKRGLSDDPEVKAALQHYNEQKEDAVSKVDGRTKQYKETLRRIKLRQERMRAKTKSPVTEESLEEANITVYLDAHDPAWMKKAMKKYGVKGKIHKKDVNPGYDSWKVTGDPKKLYKLYTDDEYGGDESFDDFIDMHKESIHEGLPGWARGGIYSVEFTFKSVRDAKSAVAFVKNFDVATLNIEIEINGKAVEFYRVGGDDKELKSVKAEVEQKFKGKIADTKIQNEETIRTEGSKEEYQKFFNAALKKFGAKSPAEMDDEKKKKFFNYIDKNWTKEEQQEFSEGELPPALKKAIAAKKAKKGGEEEDEDKDPVGEKKEEVELEEKIEYVEYKFMNKAQAKAAAKFFDGQQLIDLDVNDDGASEGLLSVDAGKNDMTKVHNAIMKKMKPKVIATENERKN